MKQGEYHAALAHFEQSSQMFTELGQNTLHGRCLTYLGFVYFRQKDARAAVMFAQALATPKLIHTPPLMLEVIIGYAWLRWRTGQQADAALLLTFVQQQPACAAHMRWLDLGELEQQLIAALSPANYRDISNQATELSLEQVVESLQNDSFRSGDAGVISK